MKRETGKREKGLKFQAIKVDAVRKILRKPKIAGGKLKSEVVSICITNEADKELGVIYGGYVPDETYLLLAEAFTIEDGLLPVLGKEQTGMILRRVWEYRTKINEAKLQQTS